MASDKQKPERAVDKRITPGFLAQAGKGRTKGIPNKTTTQLKEAILEAASKAGGKDGLVGYLIKQAQDNPQSFMTLLGRVLPLQVAGSTDAPIVHRIEIVGVEA